jgi:excisionase family DNA binding protein
MSGQNLTLTMHRKEKNMSARELLSVDDLAAMLLVPVATVYRWNYLGTGPRLVKVGRHVRYRIDDVEKWIESRSNG